MNPGPICLKFCLGNNHGNDLSFVLRFKLGPLLYKSIAKLLIYDQARVNGGSNYEYPAAFPSLYMIIL